jgi:hypothetical protein
MARFKIPKALANSTGGEDNLGYDQGTINVDGYVNVTKKLLDNNSKDAYTDFILADEDERPDMLQKMALATGEADNNWPRTAIFHQYVEVTNTGDVEHYERIDGLNCKVKIERDKRKRKKAANPDKPSRYTITLPENRPGEELKYLHEYASNIYNLYLSAGGQRDHPDAIKARQFMFGIMLLTRCR